MKTSFSHRWTFISSLLMFLLSAVLLGFLIWMKWFVVTTAQDLVSAESKSLERIVIQQNELMDDDIKRLMDEHVESLQAVEAVHFARETVFSGELGKERFEPVVLLDVLQFFDDFFARLSRKVLLNQFSLSPIGQLSFVVQSPSYSDAARQIELLRLDFLQENPEKPKLFEDLHIGSVSRTEWPLSDLENIPELFRNQGVSYDFVIQAQIHPDYYQWEPPVDLPDTL